jgi:hypothetical protein
MSSQVESVPRCDSQMDTPAGYIDTCYRVPEHDGLHQSKDHEWDDGDVIAWPVPRMSHRRMPEPEGDELYEPDNPVLGAL